MHSRKRPTRVSRPQSKHARSEDSNGPGAGILALQRSIGNAAVSDAMRGHGKFTALVQRAAEPTTAAMAPALDPHAESEADRIADRAVGRLPGGAVTRSEGGGAMPAELRRALAPDLANLAGVRFDTGRHAGEQADAMGARAFADGRRIGFAPGEFDVGTRAGAHLAAHEAAHASLHTPSSGSGGSRLVHAKLRGTRDTAAGLGGGTSTKGIRKKIGAKTNWDKILSSLGAYEAIEAALLENGNPSSHALAAAKPKMMKLLAQVEAACLSWQTANAPQASNGQSEQWHATFKQTGVMQKTDDRSKAERRQVVAMLLPRIAMEMEAVGKGDWNSTLGLTDNQIESLGREDKGAMNNVRELTYGTESGSFTGYFKSEKGFDSNMAGHDIDTGIRQADPNYGSRAMAMYRLDQLLGAGVTARVEYAVRDGKFGTVMETAKGTKAENLNYTRTDQGQSSTPGSVSLEDETLQRCLNKLQILDAISGQLDRHAGNYSIQQDDSGKVTGVTGIDLDMAFGQDMETHDSRSANAAIHYRGMPPEIDEAFGQKILSISEDDVRGAIQGLLTPSEVESTVSRFRSVRAKVEEAQTNGTLRQQWGSESTTKALPGQHGDLNFSAGKKTYIANLMNRSRTSSEVYEHVSHHAPYVFRDVPDLTVRAFISTIATVNGGGPLGGALTEAIFAKQLHEGQIEDVVTAVLDELAANEAYCTYVELLMQEHGEAGLSQLSADRYVTDAIQKVLARLAQPVPTR